MLIVLLCILSSKTKNHSIQQTAPIYDFYQSMEALTYHLLLMKSLSTIRSSGEASSHAKVRKNICFALAKTATMISNLNKQNYWASLSARDLVNSGTHTSFSLHAIHVVFNTVCWLPELQLIFSKTKKLAYLKRYGQTRLGSCLTQSNKQAGLRIAQ